MTTYTWRPLVIIAALAMLSLLGGCAVNGQYAVNPGIYHTRAGGAPIQISLPWLITTKGCNSWRCQHGANMESISEETARQEAIEREAWNIYWTSRRSVYWDDNAKTHRTRFDCRNYKDYYWKRCDDGFQDGMADASQTEIASRFLRDQGEIDKGRILVSH